MNTKLLVVILAAMIPSLSLGQGTQNYQCTDGELIRRVEIIYETGVAVPCEVHYHKDTEAPGERQVLWSAYNESGYCERKTREFIAQLEGWGWECEQDAPVAQVDDTEALMPAEEPEPMPGGEPEPTEATPQ
ncbi:MAG: hypothetical protein O6763_00540 [Gammaproteobacteria bacterium]|nr:hypothetical protein [Gammaproteobacteria bacterium]